MDHPAPSYKVIALISGGKDSFLSILECQAQGHEIVALANLYPPGSAGQDEDLNSHMYQTAGYALIPFYEEVTGIPLYRTEIKGTASQLGKEYDGSKVSCSSSHDETEDLTNLLQSIMAKHSEANAVCAGAILSTYQRTRIENICFRLNLKPLAYLWQMSLLHPSLHEDASITEKSAALLDRFATVGLDARIVKVASGGLDESFLWQSLLEPRTRYRIKAAMKRFGGSVVGEGGEFETLVLSGPRSLFRGRIIVPEKAIEVRSGQGGEAWIDLNASQISVQKWEYSSAAQTEARNIDLSQSDDANVSKVTRGQKQSTADASKHDARATEVSKKRPIESMPYSEGILDERCHEEQYLLYLDNYTGSSQTSISCTDQARNILDRIQDELSQRSLPLTHILFITVLLRSMNDFAEINAAYSTFFPAPLPPARVTIAVGSMLSEDKLVAMSAVAYRGDLVHKQGLHVQSISHWAPANIGPYSQAISVSVSMVGLEGPRSAFIAGQIPLIPHTMQPALHKGETAQDAFRQQAILALRHATRIGKTMNVEYFSHAVAFVCEDEHMSAGERAATAFEVWETLHSHPDPDIDAETSDLDAWDLKYGGQGSLVNEEDRTASRLPSRKALAVGSESVPGFLAVQVQELPRSQTIEWQVMGYAGGQIRINGERSSCNLYSNEQMLASATVTTGRSNTSNVNPDLGVTSSTVAVDSSSTCTVYMTGSVGQSRNLLPSGVTIPCYNVWGIDNHSRMLEEFDYGIVTHQLAIESM